MRADEVAGENVYIIIPIYNEAEIVEGVIKEVLESYKKVVCVDDGSTDGSAEAIKKLGVILIQHPFNLGQGAAIQTGLEYALDDPEAKYFVTFDSDGQHAVADSLKLLKTLKSENLDIALGSRFIGSSLGLPLSKKILLKMAIKFSNFTTGLKLTDTHNGLRAFNRSFAQQLNMRNPDFTHASEIIEKIGGGKFKYKEVPVTLKYTQYSRAKGQSLSNVVNTGFDVLIGKLFK